MPPDDPQALLDIALQCSHLAELVGEYSLDELAASWRTRALFEHELIILGEAVKRLSAEFRQNYPDMRWSAVAGLRDILVHRYDRVDATQVWQIASESVPQLLAYVRPLLPDQEG